MPPVVSIHVPKCAGNALLDWLLVAYGEEQLVRDYADRPLDPSSPMNIDPTRFLRESAANCNGTLEGKRVVHGHFWAKKYEAVDSAIHVTFLRDPVKRALSQYLYWKRSLRSQNLLQNYVQDHVPTWHDFLQLPSSQGTYRNIFFRDFDMGRLDFIGDADRADDETARLGTMLGFQHSLKRMNYMPDNHAEEAGNILADARNMADARQLLADEIAFYEQYVGR